MRLGIPLERLNLFCADTGQTQIAIVNNSADDSEHGVPARGYQAGQTVQLGTMSGLHSIIRTVPNVVRGADAAECRVRFVGPSVVCSELNYSDNEC